MAIDEALFSCFNLNDEPIFRLYSWFSSCSIGVSQQLQDENLKNCVQRITGGGTLFHGHDISYSILIPMPFLKKYSVKESYEKICYFLLLFYSNLGLNSYFAKDDPFIKFTKNSFCQNGFEPYDILIDGKKIGGNAQRRNKNVVFQHGSIPIMKHKNIKNNIGFNLEDFGIKLNINQAKIKLQNSFLEAFHTSFNPYSLNKEEKILKTKIAKEKYEH